VRGRFAVAVGLVSLALGPGCGALAAMASSGHRNARRGTVAGRAVFQSQGASGVVKVLDATGRLIGRQDVRSGHGGFRFVLMSGHYELKLKLPKRWFSPDCNRAHGYERAVRVRANRTTRVKFSQWCGDMGGY
jgi:hypothetical protein